MARIAGLTAVALAAAWAVACSEAPTALTEREALTPSFDAHGYSGCYKVEAYAFWDFDCSCFNPPLSGDLEAESVGDEFRGGRATGAVFHESYTDFWKITGGTIPELIDKTLTFESENIYTFLAPGQTPHYRLNARVRIVDGDVRIGNLTVHGSLTFGVGIEQNYKGVICP